MTVTKTVENNRAVLLVEGWLDTKSSPELGKEINALSEIEDLVLDFGKLEYIASSGLREILAAYKKMQEVNGKFSVINVGSEVMEVFRFAGFDRKLDIREK